MLRGLRAPRAGGRGRLRRAREAAGPRAAEARRRTCARARATHRARARRRARSAVLPVAFRKVGVPPRRAAAGARTRSELLGSAVLWIPDVRSECDFVLRQRTDLYYISTLD